MKAAGSLTDPQLTKERREESRTRRKRRVLQWTFLRCDVTWTVIILLLLRISVNDQNQVLLLKMFCRQLIMALIFKICPPIFLQFLYNSQISNDRSTDSPRTPAAPAIPLPFTPQRPIRWINMYLSTRTYSQSDHDRLIAKYYPGKFIQSPPHPTTGHHHHRFASIHNSSYPNDPHIRQSPFHNIASKSPAKPVLISSLNQPPQATTHWPPQRSISLRLTGEEPYKQQYTSTQLGTCWRRKQSPVQCV